MRTFKISFTLASDSFNTESDIEAALPFYLNQTFLSGKEEVTNFVATEVR